VRTSLNTLETIQFIGRRRALAAMALLGATLMFNGCGGDVGLIGPTPSSDPGLNDLSISSGTLTPAFVTGTTSYTSLVPNGTAFEVIRPTTANSGATMTVNGVATASGTPSAGISLAVGPNTITVKVTAQDLQTTATYTVVVTRAP
jgi:Cadherin-like beta sandwich domain